MKKYLYIFIITLTACSNPENQKQVIKAEVKPPTITDTRSSFILETSGFDSIIFDTINLDFYAKYDADDEQYIFKTNYNNKRTEFNEVSIGIYDYLRITSLDLDQVDTMPNPIQHFDEPNNSNNTVNIIYKYDPSTLTITRIGYWNDIKISKGSYKLDSIFYKGVEQNFSTKTLIVFKQAHGWRHGDWVYWNEEGNQIRKDHWVMGKLKK